MVVIDQFKAWQQSYVSGLIYKALIFVVTVIIVPLGLTFVYSSYSMLLQHGKDSAEIRTAIAVLQEQVTTLKEHQKYIFEHTNANFDATKSQVQSITRALYHVEEKVDTIVIATKPVPKPAKKTRRVKHANR